MNRSLFSIENPMPKPQMVFPGIGQGSMGWRMGAGEYYNAEWLAWICTLTPDERAQYDKLFPEPSFWNEKNPDEIRRVRYNDYTAICWEKDGAAKYSVQWLKRHISTDKNNYLLFWGHTPKYFGSIDKSCLSQWYQAEFKVEGKKYCCAEQYLMAEKARIFNDETVYTAILTEINPQKMKKLGRNVRNFNAPAWDKLKYNIVLNANYQKFAQNFNLLDFLLNTNDKVLTEASPLDNIWGIGLDKDAPGAFDPARWRGENLLGFALMEARGELLKVFKNRHLIDWNAIDTKFK